MLWKSHMKCLMAAATLAVAMPTVSYAQAAPGDNNGGGGQPGGGQGNNRGTNRGGWDPARFEQMMLDGIKTEMAPQDEEWKVIEPKLKKVMADQRDLRSGMRGMGGPGGMRGRRGGGQGGPAGGPGGGGGPGGADAPPAPPEPTTPVAKAAADLQASLKAGSADDTIDTKLSAYRDARDKAKTDMAADQKDLKAVLTAKQEATLVVMGLLD